MDAGWQLLQCLAVPMIQAPMAGGVSTPALAAAVATAGGIGSLGFAYSAPERIEADLKATRAVTDGVINANFFVFPSADAVRFSDTEGQLARLALERVIAESGLGVARPSLPQAPWYPDLVAQLEPVWDLRPQVLSFHFGLPDRWVIERARALGIVVAVTATSVGEARLIEGAGAGLVVAQGIEAGGHRGRFNGAMSGSDQAMTTLELVAALQGQVRLPVVAAGGVMDGADAARVMSAGAAAVQMGTAFLRCPESGASAAHRRLCVEGAGRGTELTAGFSGRLARGIRNGFIERMRGQPVLPFPLQNTMTGALRAAAVAADDPEHQSLWAGTGYWRTRSLGAGGLVCEIRHYLSGA